MLILINLAFMKHEVEGCAVSAEHHRKLSFWCAMRKLVVRLTSYARCFQCEALLYVSEPLRKCTKVSPPMCRCSSLFLFCRADGQNKKQLRSANKNKIRSAYLICLVGYCISINPGLCVGVQIISINFDLCECVLLYWYQACSRSFGSAFGQGAEARAVDCTAFDSSACRRRASRHPDAGEKDAEDHRSAARPSGAVDARQHC